MYSNTVDLNIQRLRDNHVSLFYGIDAEKLNQEDVMIQVDPNSTKFDRIVWNFPHAGIDPEVEQDPKIL